MSKPWSEIKHKSSKGLLNKYIILVRKYGHDGSELYYKISNTKADVYHDLFDASITFETVGTILPISKEQEKDLLSELDMQIKLDLNL